VTSYLWSEARERGIRLFGDAPGPELEHELIEWFQARPRQVVEAIEHVGREVEQGKVHSGWAVVRARLRRLSDTTEVVASDESERKRRVALVEQWLRTAGLYFDRRSEIEDELFGEWGRLRDLGGDRVLRRRVVELWERERPTGERVEYAAAERMRRHAESGGLRRRRNRGR
jgi:hypothetical protein